MLTVTRPSRCPTAEKRYAFNDELLHSSHLRFFLPHPLTANKLNGGFVNAIQTESHSPGAHHEEVREALHANADGAAPVYFRGGATNQ